MEAPEIVNCFLTNDFEKETFIHVIKYAFDLYPESDKDACEYIHNYLEDFNEDFHWQVAIFFQNGGYGYGHFTNNYFLVINYLGKTAVIFGEKKADS